MNRDDRRRAAREDLARVILKQSKKDGNYNMTQREAEKYAHSRADLVDKKRKD